MPANVAMPIVYLMNDRRLMILAGVIAAIALMVVLPVFAWPQSVYALTIERFQTLVGGGFAVVAAALTATSIFYSTILEINSEKEERNRISEQEKYIAASIFSAELLSTYLKLEGLEIIVEGRERQPFMGFEVPDVFFDVNAIRMLEGEAAMWVPATAASIRRVRDMPWETLKTWEDTYAYVALTKIKEAKSACVSASKALGAPMTRRTYVGGSFEEVEV